jgi:hypothetical protein
MKLVVARLPLVVPLGVVGEELPDGLTFREGAFTSSSEA